MDLTEIFDPAPDYGTGVARRRIRLTGAPGRVFAELEDHAHGMRCLLEHDGRAVTAVTPDFVRIPMSTCSGAGEPLAGVIGTPVGSDFGSFFRGGRARLNCTHMFDLTWLAVAHAGRGEAVRDYEIEVPDEVDGASVPARLWRDGIPTLEWTVAQSVCLAPEPLVGRHLFRGFTTWAVGQYSGDELEAALVLQKAYFVAQARRFTMVPGPISAAEKVLNTGLCHGFGAARIDQAERLGPRYDFSAHPERLLKFL
jgi:hypothetical protein